MPRVYFMEAKTEFLKFARMRTYSVSTIAFPLMFYCFFGLAMGKQSPDASLPPMARYLMATYGAFAVMGSTLFAFGAGVAVERGLGWLELKRASPMPAGAYLLAKAAVAIAFSTIVVTLLFTMGAAFGEVRMPLTQWLTLGGALIAGSLPFCAIGLTIGSFAGPNSAPSTVNLIYLPMAFFGGLWLPLQFLPQGLRQIAPLLPSYHLAQIALGILQAPSQGTLGGHVEALTAFALIFAGVAWLGNARENAKMFG